MGSSISCRIFLLHQSRGGGFLVNTRELVSIADSVFAVDFIWNMLLGSVPGFFWWGRPSECIPVHAPLYGL